jgi:hypothetical protein
MKTTKSFKITALALAFAVCAALSAACAPPDNGQGAGDATEPPQSVLPAARSFSPDDVTAVYVAGYTRMIMDSAASAGQMIVLFKNGVICIYCAFCHPMMGAGGDIYEGTYTLTDGVLSASYTADGREYSFECDTAGGAFRAQLYLLVAMGNDNENTGGAAGMNFVNIAPPRVAGGDKIYIGALNAEPNYAYCMVMQAETFTVYANYGGAVGSFGGAYEIEEAVFPVVPKITLTYDAVAIEGDRITDTVLLGGENKSVSAEYTGDAVLFSVKFELGTDAAAHLFVPVALVGEKPA